MWTRGGGDYGAPIPYRVRRFVLRTHGGICHVCKQPGATVVDHVINRKSGGTDDLENLRPIHGVPCHRDKTAREAQAARAARRQRPGVKHPGRRNNDASSE